MRKLVLAQRWPPATWGRLLPRVEYLVGRARDLEARSGGAFRIVETRADLAAYLAERLAKPELTAGLLSIEGAHALEDDPANVDVVADLGVRMISPSHFFDTAFGGSAHGVARYGLTAKGREMVARMEARGVVLDVAHASARTIDDALTVSARPVIASHTGVRGIADNARNLSDEHLAGIAASGGVVGIGFWDTACGGPDAASIARSIAYCIERIGPSHVALGLGLGRGGGRAVRRRRHGAAGGCAAGRGARRGLDPGGDGGERAQVARGDPAGGLSLSSGRGACRSGVPGPRAGAGCCRRGTPR